MVRQPPIALDQAFDYVDSVAEYDMQRVDGVKRDPSRVRRLMRSFARNVSGQAAYTTLCADMVANVIASILTGADVTADKLTAPVGSFKRTKTRRCATFV